jgi:hypothetical protein
MRELMQSTHPIIKAFGQAGRVDSIDRHRLMRLIRASGTAAADCGLPQPCCADAPLQPPVLLPLNTASVRKDSAFCDRQSMNGIDPMPSTML